MAIPPPDDSPLLSRPAAGVTLLTLLGVAIVIAAFLTLSAVLDLHESYAGFFFAFYWIGLRKADTGALPSVVAGSFAGLAISFALHQLIAAFGTQSGGLIFLFIIATIVFFFIRQQCQILLNDATMLFLTLGTVSHIQARADFRNLFESLAMSVVFFSSLVVATKQISRGLRRTSPSGP